MLAEFDYRRTRALQICIVFLTTLVIERVLNFNRAGWIGFVVMMIYVGFDSGASIHRTVHRFIGTALGILLSYFFWKLVLLDFRLMLIVIPMVLFFAFFTMGEFYAYTTIFTVTLSFLGTAFFSPLNYHVTFFFFDYFKSTVVAFFICFIFEGLVFRSSDISLKFYSDLQNGIIDELDSLYRLGISCPLNQNHFLKGSAQCRIKINQLQSFERTAKHDFGFKHSPVSTVNFHHLVLRLLHDIRLLFLLSPAIPVSLVDSIHLRLHELKRFRTSRL